MVFLQNFLFPLYGWLNYIQGKLIVARIKEGLPGKKPLGDPPFSPALWVPELKGPLYWLLKIQLTVYENIRKRA